MNNQRELDNSLLSSESHSSTEVYPHHNLNGHRFEKKSVKIHSRRHVLGAIIIKSLIVIIAIFSSVVATLKPEIATSILKGFGVLLVLGLLLQLKKRFLMPAEVKLYFLFLLWAMFDSILVSIDLDLSVTTAFTILQMGLILWAATVAHQWHPDLRIVMSGLWGIGIMYTFVAYFGNAIDSISAKNEGRMLLMNSNPNQAGQIFIFAIFASLYLGEQAKSWRTKLMLTATIPVFSGFLLYTGSRKMFIGAGLLVALWLLTFGRGGNSKKKGLIAIILLILVVAVIAFTMVILWQDSPMAKRYDAKKFDGGVSDRISLNDEALELFQEYPITGVGLMNQTVMMSGSSHSEFMDILVTTGVVGGVLYFSIYLVTFLRVWKMRYIYSNALVYDRRYFLIYSAMIFWLMFGYPRYMDLLHIIVFGSFVGVFTQAEISSIVMRTEDSTQEQTVECIRARQKEKSALL